MKKAIPYLLLLLLGVAGLALFYAGQKKNNKTLDERITLRKQDRIPYGTWVAYHNLSYLFPEAVISNNRQEPGYWDSLSNYEEKQVLIIVTGRFDADIEEMKRMTSFLENGNQIFISAQYISAAADEFLNCDSRSYDLSFTALEDLQKNMRISLALPPSEKREVFTYPGRTFHSYFSSVDSLTTDVLGYDESGRINFVRLQAGRGSIYVHLEPLAFSNYFLLHRNNIRYYEKVLSMLPADAGRVVWDEYYIGKKVNRPQQDKKNWFSVLMGMKNEEGKNSFRAAFWLLIVLLLLYVFMEMRRKQRYIPVITRPRNDSLDFVKTIGRLYYDKADHKNLGKKMSSYFLEYVRNKYKLSTSTLDDEFIRNLAYKSGVEGSELSNIVGFIRYADEAPAISSKQLMEFHRQLESFYLKA